LKLTSQPAGHAGNSRISCFRLCCSSIEWRLWRRMLWGIMLGVVSPPPACQIGNRQPVKFWGQTLLQLVNFRSLFYVLPKWAMPNRSKPLTKGDSAIFLRFRAQKLPRENRADCDRMCDGPGDVLLRSLQSLPQNVPQNVPQIN
jgi:hypothetical protein